MKRDHVERSPKLYLHEIIDFIDKGKYLRKHARKRLAIYKGMTGFKVQIKKVSKDLFPMEGSRWQLK